MYAMNDAWLNSIWVTRLNANSEKLLTCSHFCGKQVSNKICKAADSRAPIKALINSSHSTSDWGFLG
uniref:Uncharacterized protein n=1 Tax=Romanomermis culicivorax TaxID=13658 RepID=A0A915K613_ROMCU